MCCESGGAENKIIQLIEGKTSAYVFASPGCKKWDTCVPEVVLHAVGGKLTDIHGNALQYNKEIFILWWWLQKVISRSRKKGNPLSLLTDVLLLPCTS
ncbi:hypothetical protein STEG23_020235, partial [Scotinomys teguina]